MIPVMIFTLLKTSWWWFIEEWNHTMVLRVQIKSSYGLLLFKYDYCIITWITIHDSIGWIPVLATNFKEPYRNHKTSFRHSNRRNETELSKYVWNLQDAKKPFKIKWKILKKCKPYSNITETCSLCLNEKFIIICKKQLCSLNRRNELASSCPHRNRYVLRNFRVT